MQVLLNEKDKELLKKVDTNKMGWLYDSALDESETFQMLRKYDKRKEYMNGIKS